MVVSDGSVLFSIIASDVLEFKPDREVTSPFVVSGAQTPSSGVRGSKICLFLRKYFPGNGKSFPRNRIGRHPLEIS